MKMTRKVITMVMVLALMLSLAATAFATDITFSGGANGAEYSAFKLLNATDGGDGKYAYTLNTKYETILQTITGKTNEEDIIAYISGLNEAEVRAFANAVWAAIQAADLAADYTTTTDAITGADQGYYLIAETKLGDPINGTTDTYSLVMLDTVGKDAVNVVTKESVPTIEKEVEEKNDSTGSSEYDEFADYDVGDVINYRIIGTVSGRYEDYIQYRYEITDTMDKGLTLDPSTIKITIAGVDVTNDFTVTYDVTPDGPDTFTASVDLKKLDVKRTDLTITHNTEILVTYSATLNELAVVGSVGNKNEVVLKFENDPSSDDEGTPPGTTPPDINIVFTFEGIVNKVDDKGAALAGAGFTLYKYIHASNSWEAVAPEITGVTTFDFPGLDVGKYKLVETTVPAGYNKADDIEFEIIATYDETKDPVELTGLTVVDQDGDPLTGIFDINIPDGTLETDVVNKSGTELPSTGGIGTTLFYAFGSVMVLAAFVLLVTKKRMVAEA